MLQLNVTLLQHIKPPVRTASADLHCTLVLRLGLDYTAFRQVHIKTMASTGSTRVNNTGGDAEQLSRGLEK